jgi:DNA polymerase elongation subunit (family B)
MFGITAVPYSRYFNKHMSEAITSCARHTIRQGENFINDILNNPYSNNEITKLINKNHPVSAVLLDYIKYIDTDSLFVDIGSFFKQYGVNLDENENRIEIILNCAKIILDYVNKRTYEETQLIDYNSQVKDFKIMFEQEIVAKSALFVKKKKYALHVVNDDNKPTDKIKIKGLEIIRSETPEAIKNRLKEIMNMILKRNDESEIQEKIRKYRKELLLVYPEEISANITINNMQKYIKNKYDYEKGSPWQLKGTANYRRLLHELNLENEYEDITEGEKGKVLYVKKNPMGIDCITFIRWPKEFNNYIQIDYQKMIDTYFLNKINTLLKPMKKEELVNSLDRVGMQLFFGVK